MEYTMEATINRNLLKFAVQTALVCPKCGQILDMRRAVQFSWKEKEMILCAPCFDRWECNLLDLNFTPPAQVLDGRVLFGHDKVSHGQCPVCKHYGDDCTGTPKAPPERNAVHAKDVEIGKRYETNQGLTVRVLRFKERYAFPHGGRNLRTHYVCLNEKTGREITVKSAAKFKKEVTNG